MSQSWWLIPKVPHLPESGAKVRPYSLPPRRNSTPCAKQSASQRQVQRQRVCVRVRVCITHLLSTYCEPRTFESLISLHSPNSPVRWVVFVVPILQIKLRLRKAKIWVKVIPLVMDRAGT